MAIKLRPGIKKTGTKSTYEIVNLLNSGAFADAFEAKSSSGRKVFFKQYKSPTPTVAWFQGFVEYQNEIKKRIEKDPATKARCYEFIDFFTETFFYQVFEFVEGGMSLQECLDKINSDPLVFSWEQKIQFARVMMFAISGLHQAGIIHTDLKPDNLYLMPNPHIHGDFWLRIIDLDFSILTDQQAPWHGINGYVGTPLYQSPEHIRGKVPSPASDVFTCGIMLGQLIGQGHPFRDNNQDQYPNAIVEGSRHQPIKIQQPIKKVDDLQFVEALINACLDPDPSRRPMAKQVADALMGKTFDWNDYKPEIKAETPPVSPPLESIREPATTGSLNATTGIAIYFGDRNLTTANIDAHFGKYTFKGVHDDAQFLSEKQFKLYRDTGSKVWMIAHDTSATNETIVNGKKLNEPLSVTEGMRVTVGNSTKGIEKFALILRAAK